LGALRVGIEKVEFPKAEVLTVWFLKVASLLP
jgi:hypothetical protein